MSAMFERLGWKASRLTDGGVNVGTKTDNDAVLERRDERVLGAIATFVEPGSYLQVTIGDDTRTYSFDSGELVVES